MKASDRTPSRSRQSAIDRQRRASVPCGLVGCQEQRGACHILRLADAPKQIPARQPPDPAFAPARRDHAAMYDPCYDISRLVAQRYSVSLFATVRDALTLGGDAVWDALEHGAVSRDLFEAALAVAETRPGDMRANCRASSQPPAAFLLDYADGHRATHVMLDGHVADFALAQPGQTLPTPQLQIAYGP